MSLPTIGGARAEGALPFALVPPTVGRRENDSYYTTPELARVLVDLLPIAPEHTVIEPSCGGGSFVRAVHGRAARIAGVDVNPDARGLRLVDDAVVGDFLSIPIGGRFDWAIGNPPYARDTGRRSDKGNPITEPIVDEHVERALQVADNVAFLLRAAIIESEDRGDFWRRFPARHVWFLGQRPSFTGGGSDNAMYGFFWWDLAHNGPTTCSRLDWR